MDKVFALKELLLNVEDMHTNSLWEHSNKYLIIQIFAKFRIRSSRDNVVHL